MDAQDSRQLVGVADQEVAAEEVVTDELIERFGYSVPQIIDVKSKQCKLFSFGEASACLLASVSLRWAAGGDCLRWPARGDWLAAGWTATFERQSFLSSTTTMSFTPQALLLITHERSVL